MTRLALHFLLFLSGAAALGYQFVWARMLSSGIGHEMPAVLAIIAAFMAGMALGSATIDRFIPRGIRAGRWLSGLELAIGAWALLASLLIPHVGDFTAGLIGLAPNAFKHWAIAFTVPTLVLIPATAAMGATLPAMEKFLSATAPQGSSMGSIYAANTLGAVAGTLLTPVVLLPAFGLSRSNWILAGLNAITSFGVLTLSRKTLVHPSRVDPEMRDGPMNRAPISHSRIAATLFVTGLIGIGYETAGVRVLAQVLEGTIFTYAAVLTVFLLGTAAGAAGYHRWWLNREPMQLLASLLVFTSASGFLAIACLAQTPAIFHWARRLGDSPAAALGAELITSIAVFALPTLGMGALFSHLTQLARAKRGRIGDVVAWNTLGAALAPVSSIMLLPRLGSHFTLSALATGYAVLALKPPRPRLGAVLVIALGLSCTADLQIVDVPPGGRVVDFREGVMASVAVLADTNDQRTLRVDNRFQMGGTAAADAEYREAHVPLLLHPAPHRALFLGVGTAISFGAVSLYPQLHADGVELVPEVAAVVDRFASRNFSAKQQPELTLHVADARRYVRATDERYDVIIAELFHPYRDGAGSLYTREHFAAIHRCLKSNGIFCQWLPLHQLDEATLRVIVRTFLREFPGGEAWLLRFNVDVPVAALIAGLDASPWRTNIVESRSVETHLAGELQRLALADSLRLYGHWLAGPSDLRAWAGSGPLNTDDNPLVTLMAPRQAYQHFSKPYSSLQALLAVSEAAPAPMTIGPTSDPQTDFARRLSRYVAARNVYLRGLIDDAEQRHDSAIDAYVESARLSPEFTSGYAQCVTIASVIASSDPVRAKRILEQLVAAQPNRPVAGQMLERLFPK